MKTSQPACSACILHKTCKTIAMPGWGKPVARLQIWIDYPAEEADKRGKPEESRNARFINWLLRRNSLSLDDVYVGYTLRCSVPKNVLKKKMERIESINACMDEWNTEICNHAKAIVALGEISCLAFTGAARVGDVAGSHMNMAEPFRVRVYADYAPGYAIAMPSASVSISRSIWFAAEHAGLKPKICMKELQNFDYEIF